MLYRSRRWCLVLCVFVLTKPSAAHAQHAPQPFARFTPTLVEERAQALPQRGAVVFGHPADYRWEGLLVGGIGFGLLVAFYFDQPLAFPYGALAGGVVGGLIGGMIPKAPADSARAGP